MIKRIIAIMLCFTMCSYMFQFCAFAEEETQITEGESAADEVWDIPEYSEDSEAETEDAETDAVYTDTPYTEAETEPADASVTDELPAEESEEGLMGEPAEEEYNITEPASENDAEQEDLPEEPALDELEETSVNGETELLTDEAQIEAIPEQTGEPVPVDAEPEWISEVGDDVSENNEELLNGYAQQMLNRARGMLRASNYAYRNLMQQSSGQAALYAVLLPQIMEVASGERSSTVFTATPEDLQSYGVQTYWTAEELGYDSITAENAGSAYAVAAEKAGISGMRLALNALLSDCAYELYWYDKISGSNSSFSYSYLDTTGYPGHESYLQITGFTAIFKVAQAYAGDAANTVNTVFAEDINTAVSNAQSIVEEVASYSDTLKLDHYRQQICAMVSYNHEAADNDDTPYGNPWQIIWVFDGKESTNVVCEGYSKAFQYLCELSNFSQNVNVYSVSGTTGGRHMWNIVSIDGINYHADITNCDDGAIGAPKQLFLVGYDSGNISDGYTFSCNSGDIHYSYDSNMFTTYGEEALTIVSSSEIGGTVVQSGTCGENLTWNLDDKGILTISGTGKMTDYNYSSTPWYSFRADIKKAVLTSGVTSIGSYAFSNCSGLTSVTIPEGVTSVGYFAFFYCSSLESVTIPASVSEIDKEAFVSCDMLNAIQVDADNKAFSDINGVLFDNNQTTLIRCPEGMTGTYLVPSNVTVIADCAFLYSGLTDVRIPETVEEIGYAAFFGCSNLMNVTVPEGISSISAECFRFCSNMTSITLPESLEYVGSYAFEGCKNLTKIELPMEVTVIGNDAFKDCTSLKSISIPAGVRNIYFETFMNCSALSKVYYKGSQRSWEMLTIDEDGNEPFINAEIVFSPGASGTWGNLTWVLDSDGLLTISGSGQMQSFRIYSDDNSFCIILRAWHHYSAEIQSVRIESGVTNIGENAFEDCKNLESVIIADTVTSIDADAFYNCSGLKEIHFQGAPPTVGIWTAFYGVTADAYYPANKGWTPEDMQDYGGTLTWHNIFSVYALTNNQSIIVQFGKAVSGCDVKGNYIVTDSSGTVYPLSYAGSAYGETHTANTFKLNFYDPLPADVFHIETQNMSEACEGDFEILLDLSVYRFVNSRNVIIQLNEPIIGCTTAENYVMHTLDGEMIPITSAVSAFQEIGGEAPNVFRLTTAKALQAGTTYVVETRGMSWRGEACQGTIAYFTPAQVITIHALTNNQSIIVKYDKEISGCTEKDNYIVTGSNGTVYPLSYAGSAYGETHVANTFKLNFHNPLPADVFHIGTRNMSESCEGEFEILLNLSVYRFVDKNNVIIQLNEPIIGCTTAENYVMHTLSGEEIKVTSAVSAFQEIGGEAPNVFRLTTAKALQVGTTYVVETRGMSWNGQECQGTIAYITP